MLRVVAVVVVAQLASHNACGGYGAASTMRMQGVGQLALHNNCYTSAAPQTIFN